MYCCTTFPSFFPPETSALVALRQVCTFVPSMARRRGSAGRAK